MFSILNHKAFKNCGPFRPKRNSKQSNDTWYQSKLINHKERPWETEKEAMRKLENTLKIPVRLYLTIIVLNDRSYLDESHLSHIFLLFYFSMKNKMQLWKGPKGLILETCWAIYHFGCLKMSFSIWFLQSMKINWLPPLILNVHAAELWNNHSSSFSAGRYGPS